MGVARRAKVVVALLALGGCGAEQVGTGPAGSVPATGVGPELAACVDLPTVEVTRDGGKNGPLSADPVLMGVINTYTDAHPDTYAGSWQSREHGGTFVVAFTDDPAPHQAAIDQLRPSPDDHAVQEPPPSITDTTTVAESGTVVEVVRAWQPYAVLRELQISSREPLRALGLQSASVSMEHSRLELGFGPQPLDAAAQARIAAVVPPELICLEGPGANPPTTTTTAPRPRNATLIPAEGSDPIVSCHGITAPRSLFDTGLPLTEDDQLLTDFRAMGGSAGVPPGNDPRWRLIWRDDTRATFIVVGDYVSSVGLELANGRWIWAGSSNGGTCPPFRVDPPEGIYGAQLAFDPAFPAPGDGDVEVHLRVTDSGCSGVPLDGRLRDPEVQERDGMVVVALGVEALPPAAPTGEPSTLDCRHVAPLTVTVALPSPLGDRIVADGTMLPPVAVGLD